MKTQIEIVAESFNAGRAAYLSLDPLARAKFYNEHREAFRQVLNLNTVSEDLKLSVVLQESMDAFRRKLLPLTAFSTNFAGVRLQGTDKVVVPYFPLVTDASANFLPATGYNTFSDVATDSRQVIIDKRKYQGIRWTSVEFARQPFLSIVKHMSLHLEKLAADIIDDVWSLVTAANFGAPAKTELGSAFNSDDVIDLKGVADQANWPEQGRSLILDSAYGLNLLRDERLRSVSESGSDEGLREGKIRRIFGFDHYPMVGMPDNGQNLVGVMSFPSAILFASAATPPTEEVRSALSDYMQVVDPATSIAFEWRRWGSSEMDRSSATVECSYGRSVGEAGALKRITSA